MELQKNIPPHGTNRNGIVTICASGMEDELVGRFHGLGTEISPRDAAKLPQKYPNPDEALAYRHRAKEPIPKDLKLQDAVLLQDGPIIELNKSTVESDVKLVEKKNPNPGTRLDPIPPESDYSLRIKSTAMLRDYLASMGFSADDVSYAVSRTSSVEAALDVIANRQSLPSPVHNCHICLVSSPSSKMATLMCGHQYCKGCLSRYCSDLIATNKVSSHDFVCNARIGADQRPCGAPINIIDLENCASEELVHTYQRRLAKLRGEPDKTGARPATGQPIARNTSLEYRVQGMKTEGVQAALPRKSSGCVGQENRADPNKGNADGVRNHREVLRQELAAIGFYEDDIQFAIARTSSIEAAVSAIMSREVKMPANAPVALPKEAANLKTAEPSFDCPICFDSVPVSEMITLDCCHRFCKDCFVGHCSSKISSNEVQANELTCPTREEGKPCGTPITVFELQAHLPAEVFEKYERFTLRGYCETEHLVACPSCNDWFVDIQAEDMQDERLWKCIRCQRCRHKFCAKCGNVPHKGQKDQDVTCEQYAAWLKANSKADEIFEKFMQEEKIFQCPSCGHAAERKEGCKFLYCRCKSNFCALCGVLLDKSQHYSHFQNAPGCNGPYGEVCRGVRDGVKRAAK